MFGQDEVHGAIMPVPLNVANFDHAQHHEIRMHGNIAKADDFLPWDFRETVARGVGQPGGGFADDGKLLQHRALDEFVGQEARFVVARHEALDGLDGVEDVRQIQRVTPHG
jgi:hypothetical protein